MWQCHDDGDTYFAKLWKRGKAEQGDILALWHREVRGLTRLQGYPGASEIFARLHDLGTTPKHYYVIIAAGNRDLLSTYLNNRRGVRWLTNLSEATRRRPLWEGLLRVAEGLSILHDEGTLHRALSSDAIFVGSDGECDFRLSGFEWSLRVATSDPASTRVARTHIIRAPELENNVEAEYSTATDWFDFGLLAAEIFGVHVKKHRSIYSVRSSVKEINSLKNDEKDIINNLLSGDLDTRLSQAESITSSIRNIVVGLSSVSLAPSRPLVLALRLNDDIQISALIERASGGKASKSSPIELLNWVREDLRGDPRIVARSYPSPHYVVRGEALEYKVRPWSLGGSRTWDVGFCDTIEKAPRSLSGDVFFSLGERRLVVELFPSVRASIQTFRDRSAAWDKAFPHAVEKRSLPPELKVIHEFFSVTQQLDTLLTAARICPVRIVSQTSDGISSDVEVTPIEEPTRNDLATHLKLLKPTELLQDWFSLLDGESVTVEADDDTVSDKYSLLDRRTITKDAGDGVEWKFVRGEQTPLGPRYIFRSQTTNSPSLDQTYYLAKNYNGTIAQIRRRHNVIEKLKSHEGLLRFLADPSSSIRTTSDILPSQCHDIPLDSSKKSALNDLWNTQPGFAVQGPPGTGKTTLIKAFVDRLFGSDPSSQILITAHSHHTVDDVLGKVSTLFVDGEPSEKPVILRLGGEGSDSYSLHGITKRVVKSLAASQLLRGAPEFLKMRAAEMEQDTELSELSTRSLSLLIQDAANITLTTLNSADLADLVARNRRFDWSVIEEAGKAHGFDMAAALQESHRLLLIGDHLQLPPYNSHTFKDLLSDPLRIKKAIQTGEEFAPGLIDTGLVPDSDETAEFDERCQKWRSLVTLFGALFEASGLHNGSRRPYATLTDQHRMHPDIARVVGEVFYSDENGGTILSSPEETISRFKDAPPFKLAPSSWMPENRIVWCDVPWVQKEKFSSGEREGLFIAPDEAKLVVEVLRQFTGRESQRCSIQILSPYTAQLEEIKQHVVRARDNGLLGNMFDEPFCLQGGKRMGATVDEFQGSEADIVVVSLVRNNGLVPWKSVGFLKEASRMNVLLSRARQKLVIVGSWDFWASRCRGGVPMEGEFTYIGKMMQSFERALESGKMARVRKP